MDFPWTVKFLFKKGRLALAQSTSCASTVYLFAAEAVAFDDTTLCVTSHSDIVRAVWEADFANHLDGQVGPPVLVQGTQLL